MANRVLRSLREDQPLLDLRLFANRVFAAACSCLFSGAALFGIGIMPEVTTAYATVAREHLPDATAQVNILQRLGGAIGSSLFVVLLGTTAGAPASDSAFRATFCWLAGAAAWLTAAKRKAGELSWLSRAEACRG